MNDVYHDTSVWYAALLTDNLDLEMVVPLMFDCLRHGGERGTFVIPISEARFVPAPVRPLCLPVDKGRIARATTVTIIFGKRITVGAPDDRLASRTPSGRFKQAPEGIEIAAHLIRHCHLEEDNRRRRRLMVH